MHFSDDRGAPLYQKGSRGAEVKVLQQYLERAGYSPGGIDGVYGANTEAAVASFQRAYNIPADGIVYQDTFEALANTVSMKEQIVAENKAVVVHTGQGPVAIETPPPPLKPLPLPGTLGPPTWVIVAGSAASLLAFAWLLTRKAPRPALAGYSRRRRRRR